VFTEREADATRTDLSGSGTPTAGMLATDIPLMPTPMTVPDLEEPDLP